MRSPALGKNPYSEKFFLNWSYEIAGGCELTVGLQEDRTVVVIHSFPDHHLRPSLAYDSHLTRAISYNASSQHLLRKYLSALLHVGLDSFQLDRSWGACPIDTTKRFLALGAR